MQFDNIQITLSESSKDDDGNAVVESTQKVYDFDKITEMIADDYRRSKPQCSCDALYIKDKNNIFLVEFKNVRKSRVPKNSLKEKAYDSIMTLQMAFFPNYSIHDMRKKVTLVFVYNNDGIIEKEQDSASFDNLKNKLKNLSGSKTEILFDLDIYKDVLYKDVVTVEKTEFMNCIHPIIFGV